MVWVNNFLSLEHMTFSWHWNVISVRKQCWRLRNTIRKIRIAARETSLHHSQRVDILRRKSGTVRYVVRALNARNKSREPGSALDRACTWCNIGFQRGFKVIGGWVGSARPLSHGISCAIATDWTAGVRCSTQACETFNFTIVSTFLESNQLRTRGNSLVVIS